MSAASKPSSLGPKAVYSSPATLVRKGLARGSTPTSHCPRATPAHGTCGPCGGRAEAQPAGLRGRDVDAIGQGRDDQARAVAQVLVAVREGRVADLDPARGHGRGTAFIEGAIGSC